MLALPTSVVNERFQKRYLKNGNWESREVLESENVSLSNRNVGKNPTLRKRKVFIEAFSAMS